MTCLDHDRRPLGRSEGRPPAPPRISRAQIDQALLWDNLRHRAAAGDPWALIQLASHGLSPSASIRKPQ